MVIQDPPPNDEDGLLSELFRYVGAALEENAEAVGAATTSVAGLMGTVGFFTSQANILNASLNLLKDSFNRFQTTFQNEIVKSNDSLVAVNSSLAKITEEYAVTISQTALPLKTAMDALVNFEMAGLQDVPPAVLQLAGIMDLTNQKQEGFVKLMTDAMVFGGVDSDGTSQIAQNMMRVSDEFSVSFDKLVQALEPVATNSAKLALVSETAVLSNTELVTELAGTVGQDATGLLRNVIEQLGSFAQISPNEFAFPQLQVLRDQLQEGAISAEEFKEQLPLVISQIQEFIGPILAGREGVQTLERLQAGELFNLDLLAQMTALNRQIEVANQREDDPDVAGFRTLAQFQITMFDSFYESIAGMDEAKLMLLAENLGKLGAVILEFGAAVGPVVAALLESIRAKFNDTLEGGAGSFLADIVESPYGQGLFKPIEILLKQFDFADEILENFRAQAQAVSTDPVGAGLAPSVAALLRPTQGDIFARQFGELRNVIDRNSEDSVIESQAERVFRALTGVTEEEASAFSTNITDDRARAIALLQESIDRTNDSALIEELKIAIDALNNTTENALGELIEITSGGFSDTGAASRARMEQADAARQAGN